MEGAVLVFLAHYTLWHPKGCASMWTDERKNVAKTTPVQEDRDPPPKRTNENLSTFSRTLKKFPPFLLLPPIYERMCSCLSI